MIEGGIDKARITKSGLQWRVQPAGMGWLKKMDNGVSESLKRSRTDTPVCRLSVLQELWDRNSSIRVIFLIHRNSRLESVRG
jgi:hypothetical protein